ncbi:hypothetical protein COEREDRAFT_6100 [Coemansia reversa NRRL 1564]|uniref:L domain-like protein n=1 Tax=Coemansia reversa (strain ATCC 12441 / NRRL 1564) TaxID=763665 RepID=A0A2G5BIV0_COERN|nr:hypothetical protein COEREDRAFT_6100 [Coemansia reversa NRRL 1564]|eukprot:PIA18935.1 hypothetical protein COEREDRAFT_6100 [Coemansia reversa NRRL 1564]
MSSPEQNMMPQTPPRRSTPQLLGARNASMGNFTSRSPEAHRRMLQRAHSLESPHAVTGLLHQIPQTTPVAALGVGSPSAAAIAAASVPGYHFSPRRKRVAALDSSVSPRRIRRRLFFADHMDDPAVPEDQDRRREQRRMASETALAVIREAVEVGDAHVDLSDLDLDTVPDELAELKDLVVLAPSHSLVTDLQLTMSTNALRHFPLAVCELTNLTTLIISHNRITHLPPEIGNLVNLRELSVAHNRLRRLPLELARLTRLQTLSAFPNPFVDPPPPFAENADPQSRLSFDATLYKRLRCEYPLPRSIWPFRVHLSDGGVPRLADLAARQLSRAQLIALKHKLAQCLDNARPALGRIIGLAQEPSDSSNGGVLAALKAQHLVLPVGHLCAHCEQWFLTPAVELTVWAPFSILTRPAPFVVRLCSRSCLYSTTLARILVQS